MKSTNRERMRLEPQLLRAEEAAEFLNIGRAKVYEMMASGELPSIRIGRAIRVPLTQLREWLETRVGANSAA